SRGRRRAWTGAWCRRARWAWSVPAATVGRASSAWSGPHFSVVACHHHCAPFDRWQATCQNQDMASEEERRKQHRHRHKGRYVRGVSDELWADFEQVAAALDSDRSAEIRRYIEW